MEYHKIETLFERDKATFKVKPGVFRNPVYDLIKYWDWTEKIDGTNMRVMWEPSLQSVKFGGRTNNAQLPCDLLERMAELFPAEKLALAFPDAPVVIYGEGYGPGIQKGGAEYGAKKDFIAFDILVDSKWWLNYETVDGICKYKLGVDVVPRFGIMMLQQAVDTVKVGFASRLNGGVKQAEGLVGRTTEPLFDKRGCRLIVKLKTKDF